MAADESANESTEDTPADEKEKLRLHVEQMLSECESKAPRVYVLEMMCVKPEASRRKRGTPRSFNAEYEFSMWPILVLVGKLAGRVWPGPERCEQGVATMSVAMIADPGKLEDLGLGGESIWLREVESDELFETEDRCLLLQPRRVREIYSDFVLGALQTRLQENHNDARLAVLQAAGELLLDELEEDLCLIPNCFSDVVEAVDEVLSESDWFGLTEAAVKALSSEVIRRVGNP